MRRRAFALVLVLALPGCSNVVVKGSTGAPVQSTGSVVAGSNGLYVRAQGPTVLALVLAAMLIGAAEGARGEQAYHSSFYYDFMGMRQPAPELLPGRHISDVDCTKPLPETTGNLRCR